MTGCVSVTWVEDFCPEAQTGTRGLRPCLTLSVSLGQSYTRPVVQQNRFIQAAPCYLPAPGLWWRGTLAVALRFICPQIGRACVRIPEENIGCNFENCWEINALEMELLLTTICAAATSIISKQTLQYFYCSRVSSEDRSLNKLPWLWQSPEEL